jgi:hypothetical protein
MFEEFVDRPGEHDAVERDAIGDAAIVASGNDLDARIGRHACDHRAEAVRGHGLKRIGEIAVVVVRARGDASAHGRIEFGGIEPPLLARVAAEEEFVQFASDAREDQLFGTVDEAAWNRARPKKSLQAGGIEIEAVETVDRRAVDRHRQQPVAHTREHAVLVGTPGRELTQVRDHGGGVGVKDVRAVPMVAQTVGADWVVAVAADVIAPVDEQDARAQLGRETFGQRRAGQSSADDEIIVQGVSMRPRGRSGIGSGVAVRCSVEHVGLINRARVWAFRRRDGALWSRTVG